ncbi:MAG: FG-GAP-like repeat-containing protein [Myxococcota bacterium]
MRVLRILFLAVLPVAGACTASLDPTGSISCRDSSECPGDLNCDEVFGCVEGPTGADRPAAPTVQLSLLSDPSVRRFVDEVGLSLTVDDRNFTIGETVRVDLEWTTELEGARFFPLTEAGTSVQTTVVTEGQSLTVLWNALSDASASGSPLEVGSDGSVVFTPEVFVRAIATDSSGFAAEPFVLGPFSIGNSAPTALVLPFELERYGGGVPVSVQLSDDALDPVRVEVEFSEDSGTTFRSASVDESLSTGRQTGTEAEPAISVLIWDSVEPRRDDQGVAQGVGESTVTEVLVRARAIDSPDGVREFPGPWSPPQEIGTVRNQNPPRVAEARVLSPGGVLGNNPVFVELLLQDAEEDFATLSAEVAEEQARKFQPLEEWSVPRSAGLTDLPTSVAGVRHVVGFDLSATPWNSTVSVLRITATDGFPEGSPESTQVELVLAGDGVGHTGTPSVKERFYPSEAPLDVLWCDLDGDGADDLVYLQGSTVMIRLSSELDRGFLASAAGRAVTSAACEDIDGQGPEELALAFETGIIAVSQLDVAARTLTNRFESPMLADEGFCDDFAVFDDSTQDLRIIDLNLDGDLDLLVNDGTDCIAYALNQGDFGFEFGSVAATGGGSSFRGSATAADFDGDGLVDLAVGTLASDLLILRGLPSDAGLAFGNRESFPLPFGSADIVDRAQLDTDDRFDLVVTADTDDRLYVYRTGAASEGELFGPVERLGTEMTPSALAVVAAGGSGGPELHYASLADLAFGVIQATADVAPTFSSPVNSAVGSSARAIAVGDSDGDGFASDVAVLIDGADPTDLTPPSNTPGGALIVGPSTEGRLSFTSVSSLRRPIAGVVASEVVSGDLDANGAVDLVFTESGGLVVHWGEAVNGVPAGGFERELVLAADGLEHVVVADFDGDGADDLAVSGDSVGSGRVILDVRGARTVLQPPALGGPALVGADLNGNGFVDLAHYRLNGVRIEAIQFFRNTGGAFEDAGSLEVAEAIRTAAFVDLAVGDVDADNQADVFIGYNDQVSYFRGVGDFVFESSPVLLQDNGVGFGVVVDVGDYTGDSVDDIVLSVSANDGTLFDVDLFVGNRVAGGVPTGIGGVSVIGPVSDVDLVDFNQDGVAEIAVNGVDQRTLSRATIFVAEDPGRSPFQAGQTLELGVRTTRFDWPDLNGDGVSDVAALGNFSDDGASPESDVFVRFGISQSRQPRTLSLADRVSDPSVLDGRSGLTVVAVAGVSDLEGALSRPSGAEPASAFLRVESRYRMVGLSDGVATEFGLEAGRVALLERFGPVDTGVDSRLQQRQGLDLLATPPRGIFVQLQIDDVVLPCDRSDASMTVIVTTRQWQRASDVASDTASQSPLAEVLLPADRFVFTTTNIPIPEDPDGDFATGTGARFVQSTSADDPFVTVLTDQLGVFRAYLTCPED